MSGSVRRIFSFEAHVYVGYSFSPVLGLSQQSTSFFLQDPVHWAFIELTNLFVHIIDQLYVGHTLNVIHLFSPFHQVYVDRAQAFTIVTSGRRNKNQEKAVAEPRSLRPLESLPQLGTSSTAPPKPSFYRCRQQGCRTPLFETLDSRHKHERRHEKEGLRLICDVDDCKEMYHSFEDMRNHMEKKHYRQGQPEQQMQYTETVSQPLADLSISAPVLPQNLSAQVDTKGKDEASKEFECRVSTCETGFSQPNARTLHELTHRDDGTLIFVCDESGCGENAIQGKLWSFILNGNIRPPLKIVFGVTCSVARSILANLETMLVMSSHTPAVIRISKCGAVRAAVTFGRLRAGCWSI